MIASIAFIGGFLVCFAAISAPHARVQRSSIEEFVDFQNTLGSLPTLGDQNHQLSNN